MFFKNPAGGILLSNKEILNHSLVPKFEIMSEEDIELFLKEKGLTKKELPILKETDPVVPLINAKVGDVVKIIRKSVFGGTYLYYRVVE